jgi:hypothetical protein
MNLDDPFADIPARELFIEWIKENGEKFAEYEKEIAQYNLSLEHIPEFLLKSADKWIVEFLEKLKANEVKKPATTFFEILKYTFAYMKREQPIITLMTCRMAQNMELLDKFKSGDKGEKGEAAIQLKDRGFL